MIDWKTLPSYIFDRLEHYWSAPENIFWSTTQKEQIRSEVLQARLTVREAPATSRIHFEIVCPSLKNHPKGGIGLELELEHNPPIFIVDTPGSVDLNADKVVFVDDHTIRERMTHT